MKRLNQRFVTSAVRPVVILALVLVAASGSLASGDDVPAAAVAAVSDLSPGATPTEGRPGAPVVLIADSNVSSHRTPPPTSALSVARVQTAEIVVNYLPEGATDIGGEPCYMWPGAAQDAFNYATGIWETLLNSSVAIEIDACWAALPVGYLGFSVTDRYYHDFDGAPTEYTWYPVALANALSGVDQNGSSPEMHLTYNSNLPSGTDWYFGTDGSTGFSEYDFATVVLHEIAHGLGFAGSMNWAEGWGSWGGGTGYPVSYDRFTEDGFGNTLMDTVVYPNPSIALGSALTSNSVWFTGPRADAANGGARVKLYAPSVWKPASSYSHLDEIFNNTTNALMTHSLSPGESNHSPGPVAIGMLEDVGWMMADQVPLAVTSIMPSLAWNVDNVSVVVTGNGFQSGASLWLARTGESAIVATDVQVVSETELMGELDLTGRAAGSWNVVVTNLDTGSATLANAFTITWLALETEILLPLVARN